MNTSVKGGDKQNSNHPQHLNNTNDKYEKYNAVIRMVRPKCVKNIL